MLGLDASKLPCKACFRMWIEVGNRITLNNFITSSTETWFQEQYLLMVVVSLCYTVMILNLNGIIDSWMQLLSWAFVSYVFAFLTCFSCRLPSSVRGTTQYVSCDLPATWKSFDQITQQAYKKDIYDQHMENLHTKLGKLWDDLAEHDFAQTSTIERSKVQGLIEGAIEEEGHAYWHQKGDNSPGLHGRGLKRTFDKIASNLDTSPEVVPPPSKESQKKAMSALIQACRHNKDEVLQVLDQVDRKGTTQALLKLSEDVGVTLHPDLAQKALVMPGGVAFEGMSALNVETWLDAEVHCQITNYKSPKKQICLRLVL